MATVTSPAPDPQRPRAVWVAGITGLVGAALLQRLLQSPACDEVHALVRRMPPRAPAHRKLQVHQVDLLHLRPLPPPDDVYIAIGTTLKAAGSRAAFRRVDLDSVVALAQWARHAGAMRLAVVSAFGADARSRVFYNRTKGEMEAALAGLGFSTLIVARPSLLLGDRAALGQTVRLAEAWAARLLVPVERALPLAWRPVSAASVASAMVNAVHAGLHGLHVLQGPALTPHALACQ